MEPFRLEGRTQVVTRELGVRLSRACAAGATGRDTSPLHPQRPGRLLRRYDRVGPYAGASINIDAERPTAGERLLYLLARGVFVEGMDGQFRLDLNEKRPLLLGHGLGIHVGRS